MKKLTIAFAIVFSFVLGIGLGNWLSQEKRIHLIGKEKDIFNQDSDLSALAGVISVNNSVSSSAYDLQNAFNTVANVATRAVVSIRVSVPVADNKLPNYFGNDEFFRRFFGMPEQRQPRNSEAFGSGFVIDAEGYLLSNNHVVENAEEIKILFRDNDKTYTASLVGSDPDTDIALLKINEPGPFPYLVLGDSDKVQIGDIAIAIGNPFGLSHTFTTGVVSAKGRSGIVGNRYENFIQTDVAINQGNSGGPLLNLNGEVIGINSAILSKSGGSIGIGFSIPINMAKQVGEQLRQNGKVTRGWIGIYFEEVNSELSEALNVPRGSILISQVVEDSPAEKAGLKAGDVIVNINNITIKSGSDLLNQISLKSQGQVIQLGIIRDGDKKTFNITLGEEKKPQKVANTSKENKGNNQLGITVRDLSTSEAQKLGRANSGVMVAALNPNSPLLQAGIREGDVILTLNKKKIKNASDFNTSLTKIEKGSRILLQIQRDRFIRYVIVQI